MNNPISSKKHQRTRLSVSQKAEILRRFTQGAQHADLQSEFNCSRRTICNIKAQRAAIETAIQTQPNASKKALHSVRFPAIGDRLFRFVHIATLLSDIKVHAPQTSDVAAALQGIDGGDMNLINKWIAIEDDLEVREAMVSDCLEALELGEDSDDEQDADSGEDTREEGAGRATEEGKVSSMADVSRAFHEAEIYCERSQVGDALYHLRLAKRALFHVYNEQTKRRRRQTLVTEHFVLP